MSSSSRPGPEELPDGFLRGPQHRKQRHDGGFCGKGGSLSSGLLERPGGGCYTQCGLTFRFQTLHQISEL